MIYFKSCPRCRGDMTLGKDMYGRYLECLQCGYQTEADHVAGRGRPPPEAKAGERVGAA